MSGDGKPFILGGPRKYQWFRLRPSVNNIFDLDESESLADYELSLWGIETDDGWKGWPGLRAKTMVATQEPIHYLKGLWERVDEQR